MFKLGQSTNDQSVCLGAEAGRSCHLGIMGKECSQHRSVPIISDTEEMEGLWEAASLGGPWGGREGGQGKRVRWKRGAGTGAGNEASGEQTVGQGQGGGPFLKAREVSAAPAPGPGGGGGVKAWGHHVLIKAAVPKTSWSTALPREGVAGPGS